MPLLGLKVLLVEDELLIRELFEFTLRMHRAEVKTAGSVKEAIHLVSEWVPQIVVTDIGLPEADGYVLIKALRAMPLTKNIPVIALSGYVSIGREPTSNDPWLYKISKPVDPDYLIRMIVEKTNES
jgi:CheY-like chemotaxis protein